MRARFFTRSTKWLGVAAILLPLLTASCSSPPVASFAADVTDGQAPLKVTFSNSSKSGSLFEWSFGDGTSSTSRTPSETVSYEFTRAGSFVVTLVAMDGKQPPNRSEASVPINVRPGVIDSVRLTPQTIELGAEESLAVRAAPFDRFGNEIPGIRLIWETDPKAGTVDQNGLLKGAQQAQRVSEGLIVSADDGAQMRTARADVTILAGPIARVQIEPNDSAIQVGKEAKFSAVAYDRFDNKVPDVQIAFSAGDGSAGEILPDGLFRAGKKVGTFSNAVTVTAKKGDVARSGSATVDVLPGPAARVVISPPAPVLEVGSGIKFSAAAYDEYDNLVPTAKIEFSANSAAGNIRPDGEFRAAELVGGYNDAITATASEDGTKRTATVPVILNPGPVSRVLVSPAPAVQDIMSTRLFAATVVDKFGNEIRGASLEWSSDPRAGSITSDGSFTVGTQAGEFKDAVLVMARHDGRSASSTVTLTVSADPLARVSLGATNFEAGSTSRLTGTGYDRFGNTVPDVQLSWILKNSKAGTLAPDGTFTAAKVTGQYRDAIEVTARQAQITVSTVGTLGLTPGPFAQLGIAPGTIELGLGMDQQFVASAADQFGNRIAGVAVTWSVAVPRAGSISSSGVFTAGADSGSYPGAVVATATREGVSKQALAKVIVEADRIAFGADPDGDGTFELYTMLPDGAGANKIPGTEGFPIPWSESPDGRRLIYYDTNLGVYATDSEGQWPDAVLPSSSMGALAQYPQAGDTSPDGTRLVFSLESIPITADSQLDEANGKADLIVASPDGSNQLNITNTPEQIEKEPRWSPDGRQILFTAWTKNGTADIYVVNSDGSGVKKLTQDPSWDVEAAYSPDGKKIAFSSNRDGDYEVFVMNSDGSNVVQLTNNTANDGGPSWSLDGTMIAFTSDRDDPEGAQIFVMKSSGANQTRLTSASHVSVNPHWVPRKQGVPVTEELVVFKGRATHSSLTPAEVLKKNSAAVVRIETELATGTGFVISDLGHILTNNHVISGAESINVVFADERRFLATVVGRDLVRDLALIQVPVFGLQKVELGDVGTVDVGSDLLVLGYPLDATSLNITRGLFSSTKRDSGRNIDWIQTDATINAGNSGGPVFNLQGEVIGVAARKSVEVGVEGTAFVIPLSTVRLVLARLQNGETILR